MASGSSGRANAGSKGFDFASDDILCSYEDYANQEAANGNLSDPAISSSSAKEFHNNRRGRSPAFPAYSQPEDSFHQDLISAVEKTMKRNSDNLMRFLEGISSRLSQLELYCYNLDKSIGEMRSDLIRDNGESDSKLKAIEKHLQEVHRSVQILRDKQELAETQKELAKLQSSSSTHSHSTEGRASSPAPEPRKNETAPSDPNNQQLALALALPHQVAPAPQPAAPPPSQSSAAQQPPPYYIPPPQQHPESQYVSPNPHYHPSQAPPQAGPTPPPQQFPQYQQSLPQQTQLRPSPPPVYYSSTPQPESLPNSMPMQVPFSGMPQPVTNRVDSVTFGYGRAPPQQQQQQQQMKPTYVGSQPSDGYGAPGPHSALPPGSTYMMYDSDGNRAHYQPQPQLPPQHFNPGAYPPPSSGPVPNPNGPPPSSVPRSSQFVRGHPYGELVEKLTSMGFRGDHVAGVIQRMEESGQPVDFNAVLDRLSGHSSGGPQRGGWSG